MTFPYLQFSVATKLAVALFESYLVYRQRRRYDPDLKASVQVAKLVPAKKFRDAQSYGRARASFTIVDTTVHSVIGTVMTLMFVYPTLWEMARRCAHMLGKAESELVQTYLFFAFAGVIDLALDLPSSIYSTFVLEAKYGFNRTTVATFVLDMMKSIALSCVIGMPIIGAIYLVLGYFAAWHPLALAGALWLLLSSVVIVMMVLFPSVIAPLFNEYTPLENGPLRDSLEKLASRLKFPLDKIYVIDGSRRSSHSNAFFAGIIKKFICIFDSLIEQCKGNDSYVVAILCHELGHWVYSHTILGVVITLTHLAVICLLYGITAGNGDLYESFGYIDGTMPRMIGLLLFSEMLTPLDALLKPLSNVLSRRFEYQADDFAKKQGMAKELGQSLVSMHINNLSNMSPDPLYATWNYSHPTLLERLDALGVEVDPELVQVVDKDVKEE